MVIRVGQQVGNYRVIRQIGEGSFAEVYLCEHIHLKTQAAFKFLKSGVQVDSDTFRHEALLVAGLKHEHIVRVFDYGIVQQTPYLVMDHAVNGSLRSRHPPKSQLTLPLIVKYVQQIASALQYAHNKKIVHRDIKPANMLLDENDDVLLGDFGIALIINSSHLSTKEPFGTISYMAPESIEGHPSFSSDQYSLGIVVYEWLSGRLPFYGAPIDVALNQINAPPPPLHTLLPTINPGVEAVVMKAMEKKPGNRYPTVRDFAKALEQASHVASSGQPPVVVKPVVPAGPPDPIQPIPVQPVSPASLQTAIIREPPRGTLLTTYKEHKDKVTSVSWSSDGGYVASASFDKTVQIWNARNATRHLTYHGHAGHVNAVAWLPNSLLVASASADNEVHVWLANSGDQRYTYVYHDSNVVAVAWSPNGSSGASTSNDNTAQVWKADTGRRVLIYPEHHATVLSITWSPDSSRLASASYDKTIQVWNAANGLRVFSYEGHTACVWSVAWSPKGNRIASASHDKTVQVWNATNGNRLFTYTGHTSTVHAVAWSPDGRYLASCSSDGTVQIYSALDGSRHFTYRGHSSTPTPVTVYALAWSPDSKRIASAAKDGQVHVWQAV